MVTPDSDDIFKGDNLTLTCEVFDAGNPEAHEFAWFRNGDLEVGVSSQNWTIEAVTLDMRSNVSCVAVNVVGEGDASDPFEVEVQGEVESIWILSDAHSFIMSFHCTAPPSFLVELDRVSGAAENASNVSLTCHVECHPTCDVFWLRNGRLIDETLVDDYIVVTQIMEADYVNNQFESVKSTLRWNMDSLSRYEDNANYSCTSTPTVAGEAITSTTDFRVECKSVQRLRDC